MDKYEKLYNEALERARALWQEAIEKEYVEDYLKDYETIFPELAESEDERIRKVLIDMVKRETGFTGFPSQGQVLSYLEKQKEDKEELVYRLNGLMQDYIKEGKDDEEKEHRFKCYRLFWDALEDTNFFEQKEQKPSISIDQLKSMMLQYLQEAANEKDDSDIEVDTDKWAKKILGYNFEQKPAEWSEEDEDMLNSCISSIEEAKENRYAYKETDGDASYDHEIAWLKSIRPDTFQNGNSRPKTSDNWKPAQEQEEPEYYQHFDPDC